MYSPDEDPFLTDDDYYFHHRKPTSSMGYAAHVSARLAAREASDHLQRLHRRVIDLEDVIRSQGIALSEKDAGHRLLKSQLRELRELKERQVLELNTAIAQLEDRNRDLDVEVKKKSEGLDECQRKLLMLDKLLMTSLPAVEKFVANLKKLNAGNAARIKAMGDDSILSASMINISNNNINNNNPNSNISTNSAAKNKSQSNGVSDHVSDSGHPSSSASDSYNNVMNEASKHISSILDKDLADQHGNISTPPRRPSSDLDPRVFRSGSLTGGVTSSSSSSGSPRNIHPRNRRRHNSKPGTGGSTAALAMESFPADLPLVRSDIVKSLGATPNLSPGSYTPPTARRSVGPMIRQNNSHMRHESPSSHHRSLHPESLVMDDLNSAHQGTSLPSSPGRIHSNNSLKQHPSPRGHHPRENYISSKLSTEVGKVLNFSDEEGDDHEEVSTEPPPPAPPPSVNPGNTNLPSIQAPKRFLPLLSSRY